jgi:hypothetical protein
MKVLKKITNKILRDRVRSEDIRKTCQVDNINERVSGRKKGWNNDTERMTDNRVIKIARDEEEKQQEDQERGGVTTTE